MVTNVLELHVTVDEAHAAECAAFLAGELKPEHFRILAVLAAEVLMIHETRALGTQVVVCQSVEEGVQATGATRIWARPGQG